MQFSFDTHLFRKCSKTELCLNMSPGIKSLSHERKNCESFFPQKCCCRFELCHDSWLQGWHCTTLNVEKFPRTTSFSHENLMKLEKWTFYVSIAADVSQVLSWFVMIPVASHSASSTHARWIMCRNKFQSFLTKCRIVCLNLPVHFAEMPTWKVFSSWGQSAWARPLHFHWNIIWGISNLVLAHI